MLIIQAQNSHTGMTYLTQAMQRVSQKKNETLSQIRQPVCLSILNGGEYACMQDWLNWNPIVGLLEGLWHLSGQTQTTQGMEWLCQYRPDARAEFSFDENSQEFYLPTAYTHLRSILLDVGSSLRSDNEITHHVFLNSSFLLNAHPLITQMIPTVGKTGLDMLVIVAGADLFRIPDILVQVGLFHELLAKAAMQTVGTLSLVVNRLVCETEFLKAATPAFADTTPYVFPGPTDEELAKANPYATPITSFRIHECGLDPADIMPESLFLVQEGIAPGMRWNLIKQVASGFMRAHALLGDEQNENRFDNAHVEISKMPESDWRMAALLWVERNA